MALSRVKTIERINDMLADMAKLFDIGKIKPVFVHVDSAILPAELVREGYQWLVAVHQGPFQQVLNIWKLCPEQVWDRYFLFGGFEEHREMMLLHKALVHLKKSMYRRPVLFTKSKATKLIRKAKN